MNFNMTCLAVGAFKANCYILWDAGKRALVIDPGAAAGSILEVLGREKLSVACYLLTHGHVDHCGALAEVAEKFPAPYVMSALDLKWAFSASNQLPPFYPPAPRPERPAQERSFEDGGNWVDGGISYEAISTPGHSPGGACFYFPSESALFSGDTLFRGTVGRTDLPGGDGRVLTKSLARLARLPENIRVFPGHGPETSLSEEFRGNPFLKRPKDRL